MKYNKKFKKIMESLGVIIESDNTEYIKQNIGLLSDEEIANTLNNKVNLEQARSTVLDFLEDFPDEILRKLVIQIKGKLGPDDDQIFDKLFIGFKEHPDFNTVKMEPQKKQYIYDPDNEHPGIFAQKYITVNWTPERIERYLKEQLGLEDSEKDTEDYEYEYSTVESALYNLSVSDGMVKITPDEDRPIGINELDNEIYEVVEQLGLKTI